MMTPGILVSEQHQSDASKRIRVLQPAERLARAHGMQLRVLEAAWDGRQLAAGTVEGAQLVFLHMLDLNLEAEPLLTETFARARAAGVPVVVDTDDTYFRPADHGDFDAQLAPHLETMRRFAAQADLVTVTGASLADDVADFAKRTAILPNSVDPEAFGEAAAATAPSPGTTNKPALASGLRVGFAGGSTHLHDLNMILPALAEVQRAQPFELVLFGLYDRDLRASAKRVLTLTRPEVARAGLQQFATLARHLTKVRYRHVPSVPYAMFPRALAALQLDVGLCPLRDTAFNRCRSAIKYYQYAVSGAATLASDVIPYRGECPNLVENDRAAWRAALADLVSDPEARRQCLEAQVADVHNRRTWDAVAPRYAAILLSPDLRMAIGVEA